MTETFKNACQSTGLAEDEIKKIINARFAASGNGFSKHNCQLEILKLAVKKPELIRMISVYLISLDYITLRHPGAWEFTLKAFAAAVATLTCDNPELPTRLRAEKMKYLLLYSGGPTVREHAVNRAAFSLGNATETTREGMTAFHTDKSLPTPGKWNHMAMNFAEPIVFGEISANPDLYLECWSKEYCYDDDPKDIAELQKLQVERGKK